MSGSKPAEAETTAERIAARAVMNREILEILQAKLAENPSLDLDFEIPRLQIEGKRKHLPHPTAKLLQERQKPLKPKPKGFPEALLRSTAKPVVLEPLSDAAKTLIFGARWEDEGSEDGDGLDKGIRRLLKHGELVTKLLGRGGVLRCGDKSGFDIALKVVPGSTMAWETEYSALQYLAKHAPDFPAPKPHGLVGLGNSRLILMSFIPSMPLRSVWSTLRHENKLSIQRQLNQLFTRLREIKQQGGRLGGVGGEGVSDSHAWVEHTDSASVMTAAEFLEFQFSIEAPCGCEYAAFLKSLLPNPDANEPAVFTHGDVYPGNIMVDLDPARPAEYVVTGVIDWEESGFYPPWFEASKVLYTFNEDGRNDIQDWWRYVPVCIAPSSRPVEWAVGRLWDKANGINA